MTDATLQAIEWARAFARGAVTAGIKTDDIARAIVELAGMRPHPCDKERVDGGDFIRASGNAPCSKCGRLLYEHPIVPGLEFLRRRCDGEFVKL